MAVVSQVSSNREVGTQGVNTLSSGLCRRCQKRLKHLTFARLKEKRNNLVDLVKL